MNTLIELTNLTHREAESVLDKMIDLDSRIFHYASDEDRVRSQRGMRDLTNGEKLLVFYEEGDEAVGFSLITIRRLELAERVVWIVGSLAGFLPGHTGGNRTMTDAIHAMLRHKLGHPGRDYFMVSFLVNPGGYDMLVDLNPATFPSVHRRVTDGIEAELISSEARRRGLRLVVDEPGRLVATAGKSGREPFVRRRDTENIRFFEELNPRHAEGEVLGVCVPLGVGDLLSGVVRLAGRRLTRGRRR